MFGVPAAVLFRRGVQSVLTLATSSRVVQLKVVVVVELVAAAAGPIKDPKTTVPTEVPERVQLGQAASLPSAPASGSAVPRAKLRVAAEAVPRPKPGALALGKRTTVAGTPATVSPAVGLRRVADGGRIRSSADWALAFLTM